MRKENKRYKNNKAILDGITVEDIAEYLNRRPAEFMCTMHEYDIPVGERLIKIVSVSRDMKFYIYPTHKKDYRKLQFSVGIETEKNSGEYITTKAGKNYEIGKEIIFENSRGFYYRFCMTEMTKDEIIEGIIRSSDIKLFVYLSPMVGWNMIKRTENHEEIFVLESQIRERKCKLADISKNIGELRKKAEAENTEIGKMEKRMAELRATT